MAKLPQNGTWVSLELEPYDRERDIMPNQRLKPLIVVHSCIQLKEVAAAHEFHRKEESRETISAKNQLLPRVIG